MKCLNSGDFSRLHSFSKRRWLFCSAFTLSLVLGILALPFWDFHLTAEVSEPVSENAVSVVKVTRRSRAKMLEKATEKKIDKPVEKPVEEKTKPKIENPVPAIQKEPVGEPFEEIEEDANMEEPSENAESSESDESGEGDFSENAGESTQSPVVSEETRKAFDSYKSYALGRIAAKKTYPYSARSKGLEGKVRVRVVIDSGGALAGMEILEPCAHEILNEACLASIKKAAPFKKMKGGLESITLTFVMDFSLK